MNDLKNMNTEIQIMNIPNIKSKEDKQMEDKTKGIVEDAEEEEEKPANDTVVERAGNGTTVAIYKDYSKSTKLKRLCR